MTADALRAKVFADLHALGFRPAGSLPSPDVGQAVRPAAEIAARLTALDALFVWVAAPEDVFPADAVLAHAERNGLRDWLTPDEAAVLDLPRPEAHEEHVNLIGWRLENMWPLAWALGFDQEPDLGGTHSTRAMMDDFLPGPDGSVADLLARSAPRPADEVVALEYRFYCAHNAVRSAQLGGDTVPPGFHPVGNGGAIHERRHALTWCVSPGVSWDDTDLST